MLTLVLTLALADPCADWIARGSGRFADAGGTTFYGVGSVDGIKNPGLRRVTAQNRARAQVAMVFETFSGEAAGVYFDSVKDGPEEVSLGPIVKGFSAVALAHVRIVDMCDDGNASWALAKVPLSALLDHLAEVGLKGSAALLTPERLTRIAAANQTPGDPRFEALGRARGPAGTSCEVRHDLRSPLCVAASSLRLTFPCELDGPATVRLDDKALEGDMQNGYVNAHLDTPVPGCQEPAQIWIQGSIEGRVATVTCTLRNAPACTTWSQTDSLRLDTPLVGPAPNQATNVAPRR